MQMQDSIRERPMPDRTTYASLWEATVRVILLLLALTWWSSILPRATSAGRILTEGVPVLRPGTIMLPDQRIEATGDWVVQLVGDTRFLSTRAADDRLRFRFLGTSLALTVRMGPDAGPVVVSIVADTADSVGSPTIEIPLDLERSVTRVTTVTVAEGLAPRVHTVEIRNTEDAELALSAVVIGNTPGIWWAWIGPVVIGLLALAAAFFRWWLALATALGWSFRSVPQ